MRWEILAGPGKDCGFYLNYNIRLCVRFFSRYVCDPIYLCRWLPDCSQSTQRQPKVPGEEEVAGIGQAPGPPVELTLLWLLWNSG